MNFDMDPKNRGRKAKIHFHYINPDELKSKILLYSSAILTVFVHDMSPKKSSMSIQKAEYTK